MPGLSPLDRVRYPDGRLQGSAGGYNPVTLARFNARYGRTGQRDNADPLWQQWRRDQVTQLVRRIYLETTAIKPTIKVSAATITYGFGPTSAAEYTASRTVYTGVGGFYGLLGADPGRLPRRHHRQRQAGRRPRRLTRFVYIRAGQVGVVRIEM